MSLFGSSLRYGNVAQAFHWVTAALVATAWLTAGRDGGMLHESLGFSVFLVVAARLIWRLFDRRPKHELPVITTVSSRLVHAVLYALLFAIPLSAIAGTWLEGHSLTIYGMTISPLVESSRQVGHQILEVHQLMGTTIMWVAGGHAVAALFHHFVRRDGVLRAMLPGARA